MKHKKVGLLLALGWAGATLLRPATATELWDPQTRGIDNGIPVGAVPPPGFYLIDNNFWASFHKYDSHGNAEPNSSLNGYINVPGLIWVPGVKALGGDLTFELVQPFNYTSASGLVGTSGSGNWGLYNTVLIPGIGWKLTDQWHLWSTLAVYVPDASSTVSDLVTGKLHNGGLPSGNDYWTAMPRIGVSWLHSGWNLSGQLGYAIALDADTIRSIHYSYKSAPELNADLTATKTLGKWTFGVGAHWQQQFSEDKLNGVKVPDSKALNWGLGPTLEYNWGKVSLTGQFARDLETKNDVGGNYVNVRLIAVL